MQPLAVVILLFPMLAVLLPAMTVPASAGGQEPAKTVNSEPLPPQAEVVRLLGSAGGYHRGFTIAGGNHDTCFAWWLPGFAFDIDSQFDKGEVLRVTRVALRRRGSDEAPVVIPGLRRRKSMMESLHESGWLLYLLFRLVGEPTGMTPEEVAKELRRFHKETDKQKGLDILTRLAPTRDPRVGLALASRFEAERRRTFHYQGDELDTVTQLLSAYYLPPTPPGGVGPDYPAGKFRVRLSDGLGLWNPSLDRLFQKQNDVRDWLDKNREDLERRAARLPR
jgi:hypothetical protein